MKKAFLFLGIAALFATLSSYAKTPSPLGWFETTDNPSYNATPNSVYFQFQNPDKMGQFEYYMCEVSLPMSTTSLQTGEEVLVAVGTSAYTDNQWAPGSLYPHKFNNSLDVYRQMCTEELCQNTVLRTMLEKQKAYRHLC